MVNFLPIISTLNFYLVNNILRSLTLKLDLCTEWFLTSRKWPPPSRPLKLYIFFIIFLLSVNLLLLPMYGPLSS